MKNPHGYIGLRIIQKRIDQLRQALLCMRKPGPEDKAARENILGLSDHFKRDAGLDHILDDQ